MFIGIDPGKSGGFCLLDAEGQIKSLNVMPTIGGKIDGHGIASLYREYRALAALEYTPKVYIEKIFTMPTDDSSKERAKCLSEAFLAVGIGLDIGVPKKTISEAIKQVLDRKWISRGDGRVGTMNYAKGAGMLHMCAIWNWPITEISPRTWGARMKIGVCDMTPKAASIATAKRLWPELFEHGELSFYTSTRCKKPHEGILEAALIAEYGRKYV